MPGEEDVVLGDAQDQGGGSPPAGGVQQQISDQGQAANADQGGQLAAGGGVLVDGNGQPMPPAQNDAGGGSGGGGGDSGMSGANLQATSQQSSYAEAPEAAYTDGPTTQGAGGQGSGALNTPPASKVSEASYARVVATAAKAFRQAAQEMGKPLSDSLLSMILAQINNESAFGVTGSMTGTNNWGAAQATPGFATKHKGQMGFGAFMHRDSDPTTGAFPGWYWIVPRPIDAARVWLQENWWGAALLNAQPQTPSQYASILYNGGYFGGFHKPERPKPPRKAPYGPGEQANIDAYASGIASAMGRMASIMNGPADDPTAVTVNPKAIPNLSTRGVTAALFATAAKTRWASWVAGVSWSTFQAQNGIIWFGPPPPSSGGKKVGGLVALVGAVLGVLGLIFAFGRK